MRLIDADKLIEHLKDTYNHEKDVINSYWLLNTLIDKVDEVPTDYDVDKLLKQLEENFKPDIECFDYAEDYEYSLERYNRIIETVKRGGKEKII